MSKSGDQMIPFTASISPERMRVVNEVARDVYEKAGESLSKADPYDILIALFFASGQVMSAFGVDDPSSESWKEFISDSIMQGFANAQRTEQARH